MRRWVWNILCALSLLLFVSSITLWVRSYFVADAVSYSTTVTDMTHRQPIVWLVRYGGGSNRGAISVGRIEVENRLLATGPRWRYQAAPPAVATGWLKSKNDLVNFQWGGFILIYSPYHPIPEVRSLVDVGVPLWIFLAVGIPPVLWWQRHRRKGGVGFPIKMNTNKVSAADGSPINTD